MPAVIRLDFDPVVSALGISFRLQDLVEAAIVLLVLLAIAIRAGRYRPSADAAPVEVGRASRRLRRDDLVLIAFGALPGALVGGRLGYALLHLDYYLSFPAALVDPSKGGLELAVGVVLGTLSGLAVARLLAAPVGRWLEVAGWPVLLGLGLGKLAMVLGGSGQGAYSDSSWATTYVQAGPWGSLNAAYPALPSQALEGGLALAGVVAMLVAPAILRFRVQISRDAIEIGLWPKRSWRLLSGGRVFATSLVVWAAARFAAAFTWRDARVFGPLCTEQLILLGLAATMIGILAAPRTLASVRSRRAARRARRTAAPAVGAPAPELIDEMTA